jgi:hypothetical protein
LSERGTLLPTLERLFEGPPDSMLTLAEFLRGLEGRSYAFAIAALNIINVIPTGIPWLSTITGIPMLIILCQYFLGRPAPQLPEAIGRRGLSRGKLQNFLARAGRHIARIEAAVHPRYGWWLSGLPRRVLLLAWLVLIVLLALPVPFDNFLPACAILFFCLALMEDDGVMAMLGWLFTVITAAWTVFLFVIGHAAIIAGLAALRSMLFD